MILREWLDAYLSARTEREDPDVIYAVEVARTREDVPVVHSVPEPETTGLLLLFFLVMFVLADRWGRKSSEHTNHRPRL